MGFFVSPHTSRKSHSAPTNTYQSPSGYIFRLKIPKDLKKIVGKVESGILCALVRNGP